MWRFRKPVPKVSSSYLLLMALAAIPAILPDVSFAQCSGGTSLQTTTDSAILTSTGATGSTYSLTLPQFDVSTGNTLISAVLKSTVTTSTTLFLQNTSSSEQFYTPSMGRSDLLKLNGTTVTGASGPNYSYPFTDLTPAGTLNDTITYGPNYIYQNTPIVYDSISNGGTLASSYEGTGNLNLTYRTTFTTGGAAGVNSTPTIADTIKFSVTYYYCAPNVLAVNILNFTATKTNAANVALKWSVSNEETGRTYVIQVSQTGNDYNSVTTQSSNAAGGLSNYSYNYPIPANVTGKLYFRIEQIDADGSVAYSTVELIDADAAITGFSIYPNPAIDYVNLTLPGDSRSWQVDILAADGNLVQRNTYANTSLAHVNFGRGLSRGTYFVRANDLVSGLSYTASFVVIGN